jgi:NTP pyrophosphatase (non-canonical NTP hydrolase)
MEFKEFIIKAKEIKDKYDVLNGKKWVVAEYTQGFVCDVGDLMKLVMAKGGSRKVENVDQKLKHELFDCLWSIIIIADELGIDLESEFVKQANELKKELSNQI